MNPLNLLYIFEFVKFSYYCVHSPWAEVSTERMVEKVDIRKKQQHFKGCEKFARDCLALELIKKFPQGGRAQHASRISKENETYEC